MLINPQAEVAFGQSERDIGRPGRLLTELEHTNRQPESAYEELQSTNDALRERSLDLDEVNDFLESVLTSIRAGPCGTAARLLSVDPWR